jgi:hypothetical protein
MFYFARHSENNDNKKSNHTAYPPQTLNNNTSKNIEQQQQATNNNQKARHKTLQTMGKTHKQPARSNNQQATVDSMRPCPMGLRHGGAGVVAKRHTEQSQRRNGT